MAEKSKEEIESEILKEAHAAAAKEKAERKEKAPSAPPQKEKKEEKPAAKKGIVAQATEAVKGLKLPGKEPEEKEAKIVLERVYTVPLRICFPRTRRTRRVVAVLKEFAAKHMKAAKVRLAPEVNDEIWAHGSKKPPASIRVSIAKNEEGVATVTLKK